MSLYNRDIILTCKLLIETAKTLAKEGKMTTFIIGLAAVSLIVMAVCNVFIRNAESIGFIEILTSIFFVLAITFLPRESKLAINIFKVIIILNIIFILLMATSLKAPKIAYRLFNAIVLVVEAILLITSSLVDVMVAGTIGMISIIMLIFYIVDDYWWKKNSSNILK